MPSIIRLVALVAGVFSAAVAKADERYICDLKSYSQIGWIPEKVIISFDEGRETGWVYDYFIKEFHGEPMPVSFSRRKDHIFNFKWRLDEVEYSNAPGSNSPQYRAMLNLRTMKMNETVVLQGMDSAPLRGQGKCKLFTG